MNDETDSDDEADDEASQDSACSVWVQEEMGEVVAMFTEAAEQGHMKAQKTLANLYYHGEMETMVETDHTRAFALFIQAAEQGDRGCQSMPGVTYTDGDGCEQSYEEAIKWYSRAQNHVELSCELGLLLKVLKDSDGAIAASRAAIVVDPGHAGAQCNLCFLLQNKCERKDFDGAVAAYRAAIVADPG